MLSCCKSDIVVEKLQICVETIFCRERFECIYSPAERLPTPPTQPSTSVMKTEFFLILDNPLE